MKEEEKEQRLGYSVRGKRRQTRRSHTNSNLQQCFRQFGSLLSLYFYKASRNTSSAIHFISIPTPASHLHSVSFTSPFHFSACQYISWMITYCQFLHWHSTGQDTTLPASKAGDNFPILCFFLLVHPSTRSPTSPLRFPATIPQPSWSNPDLCHMTFMSPPAGPSDSPGTQGGIICLTSLQKQMSQALDSWPDCLSKDLFHHRLQRSSAGPQSLLIQTLLAHYSKPAAVQIQAGFIKSNLTCFFNHTMKYWPNFTTQNECEN